MTKVSMSKKPKLKNPILLVGLPGIGNIGRVAVGYLIEELKAKKFAELYSKHFFPFVVLHNSSEIKLLKNYFYYWKNKKGKHDLVFLTGDCQSQSPEGHYEVVDAILDVVEKLGIKEIFTIGGLATGEVEEKPLVYGSVTDEKVQKKYKKFNIDFHVGKRVGYIVGAAGLVLGLGKERGIDGMCILGETSGFPIVTDPKAAEVVLDILMKIVGIKVDMTKLEKRVKEMERFIKKIEDLQRKAVMDIVKSEKAPVKKDELRYIG